MTGKGRQRTLTWRLRRIQGQRVVFWEKGRDVAKIIGSTAATTGSLRFQQRTATVAGVRSRHRYSATATCAPTSPSRGTWRPPALKPGRPGRVRVAAAKGGAVRVTWTAAPNAQQYMITVRAGDGARLVEFAGGKARSLVVHDVVPIKMATVTVTAQLDTGVAGPSVGIKFAQPKHRRKRHK